MGHDIYGARSAVDLDRAWNSDDPGHYPFNNPETFPYLRYNMSNRRAHDVYEALKAIDLDGGVSGVGEGRTFTRDEIAKARYLLVEQFPSQLDWCAEQERHFFDKLLEYTTTNGTCFISFG